MRRQMPFGNNENEEGSVGEGFCPSKLDDLQPVNMILSQKNFTFNTWEPILIHPEDYIMVKGNSPNSQYG